MATFTSKASGDWDATGQTTWNEVGFPGASDDVSIGAHTITLDSDEAFSTLGLDHASAVVAIGTHTLTGSGLVDGAGTITISTGTLTSSGQDIRPGAITVTDNATITAGDQLGSTITVSSGKAPTLTCKRTNSGLNIAAPEDSSFVINAPDGENSTIYNAGSFHDLRINRGATAHYPVWLGANLTITGELIFNNITLYCKGPHATENTDYSLTVTGMTRVGGGSTAALYTQDSDCSFGSGYKGNNPAGSDGSGTAAFKLQDSTGAKIDMGTGDHTIGHVVLESDDDRCFKWSSGTTTIDAHHYNSYRGVNLNSTSGSKFTWDCSGNGTLICANGTGHTDTRFGGYSSNSRTPQFIQRLPNLRIGPGSHSNSEHYFDTGGSVGMKFFIHGDLTVDANAELYSAGLNDDWSDYEESFQPCGGVTVDGIAYVNGSLGWKGGDSKETRDKPAQYKFGGLEVASTGEFNIPKDFRCSGSLRNHAGGQIVAPNSKIKLDAPYGLIEGDWNSCSIEVIQPSVYNFDLTANNYFKVTDFGNHFGDNYTGDITLSLWFKADATDSDDGIWDLGPFSGSYKLALVMQADQLSWREGSGWRRNVTFTDTSSWHHVMCVHKYNDATNSKIYLDGVLKEDSASDTSSTGTKWSGNEFDVNSEDMQIGAYHSASYLFDGRIADVRVYKSALGAADAEKLSEGINRGSYLTAGGREDFIGWWKMNEITRGDEREVNANSYKDVANYAKEYGNQVNTTGYAAQCQITPTWQKNYDDWEIGFLDNTTTIKDLTVLNGNVNMKSLNILDFDGTDDVINESSITGFTTNGTLSCWFNPDDLSAEMTLIDTFDASSSSTNRGLLYLTADGTGEVRLIVSGTLVGKYQYTSAQVAVGKWTHYTGTFDTTNDVYKLYINGEEVTNALSVTASDSSGIDYIRVGSDKGNAYDYNGQLKDVKYYNDRALNAHQARALYHGYYPVLPYLWWKLDEGTGASAADSGTGNNAGTITNATWVEKTLKVKGSVRAPGTYPSGNIK